MNRISIEEFIRLLVKYRQPHEVYMMMVQARCDVCTGQWGRVHYPICRNCKGRGYADILMPVLFGQYTP